MLNGIKEHLPEWFDVRDTVLISQFESEYIKEHIEERYNDKDVKMVLEKEIAYQECMENYTTNTERK